MQFAACALIPKDKVFGLKDKIKKLGVSVSKIACFFNLLQRQTLTFLTRKKGNILKCALTLDITGPTCEPMIRLLVNMRANDKAASKHVSQ